MTLATGVLDNLFPFQTKHKSTIPSIPMCYAICHNVKKIISIF